MHLPYHGLEGFTHPALRVGDGSVGVDPEQDPLRLLDLEHPLGHEPLPGVQPHYSAFMVNDALNLSIAATAADATSTAWETLGLPTGGAVVHVGSSGASSSNEAPPGMLPWAGGFAHEDFVRMEADNATRQHEAALDASTPGRGPLQAPIFGWSRSAQSYGWENSAQMEANVGWGAPDDPNYVQSIIAGSTVHVFPYVEDDPASAGDHRNGADIASDTFSPGAGSGDAPAGGSSGSTGGVSEAYAGWGDLNGADLQSDRAAAAASPGTAATGAASASAATGGEAGGDAVEGDASGVRNPGGSSGAATPSDASGVSSSSGGAAATDPGNGTTGALGDGAARLIGYNADGHPIFATGSYAPQGEIRAVDDAPTLGAGASGLLSGEQGASPMRDDNGTLLYRISGGQRDGQIVLIQPAGGPSAETVVVTGSRSSNDTDRAISGTNGLRLSSAQLDDALLLPAQVGQAALVVVAAEVRSGHPALMAWGGATLVGAYGVVSWLDDRGGPAQQVAWLPEDLRNPSPLINPSSPGREPLPGHAPHPENDNALMPGGAADQSEGLTGALPGFGGDGQTAGIDDSIITRDGNANNNLDRARQRHAANTGLADPDQLIGTQVAGVGTWVAPETPRGAKGADYEEQVTGAPFGLELNVGGTVRTTPEGTTTATGGANFDGVRIQGGIAVLVDAKDWADLKLVNEAWWVKKELLPEASRQVTAVSGLATDVRIEWVVPDQATAQAVAQALRDGGYQDDIHVVIQPKTGG